MVNVLVSTIMPKQLMHVVGGTSFLLGYLKT